MSDGKKKISIELDQLTLWKFGTFLFGVLFIISWATGGFGSGSDSGTGGGTIPTAPSGGSAPTSNANVDNLDLSDNYAKGDKNAKVTIVEFSDFQCPFCSRFFTQTLPQIQENYIDTGKVKFYYADFPLESIHQQAMPAALAARCAGEQDEDAFWDFHDLLFSNQQALSDSNYKQWADDLGLDTDDFNDCLDSKKYQDDVRKDMQEGSSQGIRGTPGSIVNTVLISGACPFSTFQQAIDAEINGQKWSVSNCNFQLLS